MSIKPVMPCSHLILCRPLLLLPPVPPSIRVFSNESTLHMRWPKYSTFSFIISPSTKHSGLIFFRILVGSPCSPRDSQESSPKPQFKSINSLALSFLYTSIVLLKYIKIEVDRMRSLRKVCVCVCVCVCVLHFSLLNYSSCMYNMDTHICCCCQ